MSKIVGVDSAGIVAYYEIEKKQVLSRLKINTNDSEKGNDRVPKKLQKDEIKRYVRQKVV